MTPQERRDYMREYHKRPEARAAHRARQRNYLAQHREQERERTRRWRREQPAKSKAGARRYYLENQDAVKAKTATYRAANIEAYREYSREYKRRKRGGGERLPRGYAARLIEDQNGLCAACGCDLCMAGKHLDHIIAISRGGLHTIGNVQFLCPTCNRRKSARDFAEFLAMMAAENV
jgi:5-methylcytosine-specific restriction endonuclease McrA